MAQRKTNSTAPEPQSQLNIAGQVQIVARTLQGLRTQRFQVEVVQTANDHTDKDLHPERGVPYSEVVTELEEAEARLIRKYKRLMPQVDGLLNAGDKKEGKDG